MSDLDAKLAQLQVHADRAAAHMRAALALLDAPETEEDHAEDRLLQAEWRDGAFHDLGDDAA